MGAHFGETSCRYVGSSLIKTKTKQFAINLLSSNYRLEDMSRCMTERKTPNGERGTENAERGTGNVERGTWNVERGTGNVEQRTN